MEGLIDVAAEKARLEKAVAKLDKDLTGLNGRLNNPKFRANASEDVIAETEELAAQKSQEQDRLKTALARLAELD